MACPICGEKTLREVRPFCSKRCADKDLGKWLTGQYTIPVSDEEAESLPEGAGPDGADDKPSRLS